MEKYIEMLAAMGVSQDHEATQWNGYQATNHEQGCKNNSFQMFTLVKSTATMYSSGMRGISDDIYRKVGNSSS